MRKTAILVAIIALFWAVPAIATPPPSIVTADTDVLGAPFPQAQDTVVCECVCVDNATCLVTYENDQQGAFIFEISPVNLALMKMSPTEVSLRIVKPMYAIELTFKPMMVALAIVNGRVAIELLLKPVTWAYTHQRMAIFLGQRVALIGMFGPRLAIDVLGQRVSLEMGLNPVALIYEMGKTEVLPRQIWPNQIIITSANCAAPCDGVLDTTVDV